MWKISIVCLLLHKYLGHVYIGDCLVLKVRILKMLTKFKVKSSWAHFQDFKEVRLI